MAAADDDDDDFWVVEYPGRPELGSYREVAPSPAEAERAAAGLRARNVAARAYRFDPNEASKLGELQRAILQSVQERHSPYPPGTTYERKYRVRDVADKMERRGFFVTLPYNHPDVVAGGGSYRLTRLGKAALKALQNGRALPKKRR